MARVLAHKADMPVYAATGVPTGSGLHRVIHTHRNRGISSGRDKVSNIVRKAHITVRTVSGQLPVHINAAACHHPVKLQEQTFIGSDIGLDGFAVPSYSGRKISSALPRRVASVKLTLNAPVMRHIHLAPTINMRYFIN